MMHDSDYMRLALALAAKGAGYVSPNPMVGAVVVQGGRVVGEGCHVAVGGWHAEVNALNAAGEAARGATLYVTLEPCNHQGRTPPCTEKILQCGVSRVVSAMADPNPMVCGGGHERLRSQGVEVVCGVCEAQARRLNEAFIKYVRTKRPFVTLKLAATLDGRIAAASGDSRWVTGPDARIKVHEMRHAADAILVGIGTVRADDPELTTRLPDRMGVDPARFILDAGLTLSENARVLDSCSSAATYVVCAPGAGGADKKRLSEKGATILEIPSREGRILLPDLMEKMGAMGISSVLIEGGARVASDALASGIVDKLVIFYAPKVLGGDDGVPLFKGPGAAVMKDALPIHEVRVEHIGDDIMVKGYLHRVG